MTEAQSTSSVSVGINEIVLGLFPSWITMVATLISLLLSTILLHYFFRRPIKNALLARQQAIQQRIDAAAALEQEAQLLLDRHNREIMGAHARAQKIISDARAQAERLSEQYVREATKRAVEIKDQARREMAREAAQFEATAREYILETAVTLARSILEREVTSQDNDRLLERLLSQINDQKERE